MSAANTDPAQISFSQDGNVLVVTEKTTNVVDTFTVNDDGLIDQHQQFETRPTSIPPFQQLITLISGIRTLG